MIDCSYIFIKRHTTIPFLNTGGAQNTAKKALRSATKARASERLVERELCVCVCVCVC